MKPKNINYPDTRIVGKFMESNTILLAGKISSSMKKDIDTYCHEHAISQSEFIRIAAKKLLQNK